MELTLKQAENRLKDIADELERLDGKDELTDNDNEYWGDLVRESDEVFAHKRTLERAADRDKVRALADGSTQTNGNGTTRVVVERGSEDTDPVPARSSRRYVNPWDLSEIRSGLSPQQFGSEIRARALDAVEVMPATSDPRREAMTVMIERWDTKDGRISTLALNSSDETYVRAFGKLIASSSNLGSLDHDEQASVARAMTMTSNAGGYLIPFQLDPNVILTSDGSFNEVRQAARTVVATSNVWNGVSSAGVTGSWDNEAVEVSDDAATFAQPTITICKEQIFVPISLEALADEMNVAQEVADQIAFEADRLESVAFVTGSGTNQPQGIVTALSGTASVVNTTTADQFGLQDLYGLDGGLPARYRFRASWLGHRKIYNAVRQFDTSGGAALWVTLGSDVPGLLIGKPAYEAEGMANAASGTNNKFLIFGDFSNYVIADRVGTTIEFIPQLFGASGRPTGQRGWFAYKRVGADSVNDGAFRMLNGQ